MALLLIGSGLSACDSGSDGDDSASTTKRSERSGGLQVPAGVGRTVTFTGDRVSGNLYVLAGRDENFADVYRLNGDPAGARRLTRNGRLSAIAAAGGHVVVSDARGSGSDRVEVLRLDRGEDGLPGTLLASAGQQPDVSAGGRAGWVVPRYGADGADAGVSVQISDLTGGAKRAIYRSKDDLIGPVWRPGDSPAGLRRPEQPDSRVVLGLGEADQREIDAKVSGAYRLKASSDGRLVVSSDRAFSVISRAGAPGRAIETPWNVLCWTPDGDSLLAARGDRLALLDPATGQAREVAKTNGATPIDAAWDRG